MISFSPPGAGSADETNLRLLIESMDDPVWLVDASCTILQCNSAFRNWVSHFIGKPLGPGDNVLNNGKDPLYFHKFDMCYRLALGGKSFKTVEDQLINGVTHYTSVSFKPLVDDNGKVVAVSCYARDITEQRQHLFHIERQNSTLREIAFIESHKIRGPVATILGLEQFFNYKDLSDPVNREIMEGVKTVTLELDSFIREVVRLSNEIDRKTEQDDSEGSAQ
jgi:nitrogen-specific signal transduction histidine kinase